MSRREAVERILSDDHADVIADSTRDRPTVLHPMPDSDVPMVSRSVRVPLDIYESLREAAEARGIGVTTLMRQFIEAGLAELDEAAVVSLSDARRALASLAKARRPAA